MCIFPGQKYVVVVHFFDKTQNFILQMCSDVIFVNFGRNLDCLMHEDYVCIF